MNDTPDLVMASIKMLFSLGIVLLVVWGLYRVTRRGLPTQATGANPRLMQIVESQYVGTKKSIAMVQVPGAVLVLGIGADNIRLLSKIDDPNTLKDIETKFQKHHCLNFKDQLKRFVGAQPDQKNEKKVVG